MKSLIVANWKTNPSTKREAQALARGVMSGVERVRGVDVMVAPPFPYLASLRPYLRGAVKLAAQNVSAEPSGAFTGEVSAAILHAIGVRAVIIGHSERRRFFGESDDSVNKKIKMALRARLTPILAIGDDLSDAHDVVPRILADQLSKGLAGISKRDVGGMVVAYEPVWAIGTGRADSPDNATRRAIYIRKLIAKIAGLKVANSIRILYGGSVNAKNAASFLASDIRGMDGLLVGGASLRAHEFTEMVRRVALAHRR